MDNHESEEQDKVTPDAFASDAGITMSAEWLRARPDLAPVDRDGWQHDASHWRLTLRREGSDQRRRLTVFYSMGSAHKGEPKIGDVIGCLASDARDFGDSASAASMPFEEWAGNLGYDTDSRKAMRTYQACLRSAMKLRRFLGDELYHRLLWTVED